MILTIDEIDQLHNSKTQTEYFRKFSSQCSVLIMYRMIYYGYYLSSAFKDLSIISLVRHHNIKDTKYQRDKMVK